MQETAISSPTYSPNEARYVPMASLEQKRYLFTDVFMNCDHEILKIFLVKKKRKRTESCGKEGEDDDELRSFYQKM